jgi:hypothetical protein
VERIFLEASILNNLLYTLLDISPIMQAWVMGDAEGRGSIKYVISHHDRKTDGREQNVRVISFTNHSRGGMRIIGTRLCLDSMVCIGFWSDNSLEKFYCCKHR